MSLNELAREFWQVAEDHGFHDVNNSPPTWCANLHGEVSEFWEAWRKGVLDKLCDKAIELTCAEEELADIVIRALEVAEQMGIDMDRAVAAKHAYNKQRPYRHGGKQA